jgi:hypothetical protein
LCPKRNARFFQQPGWQAWAGNNAAGLPLLSRYIQRDAKRVDGPGLRVIYLAGLDVRDPRLSQFRLPGKGVLRQTFNATLIADEPSEQDAEALHFRNFR